jgi:hypothetical protein
VVERSVPGILENNTSLRDIDIIENYLFMAASLSVFGNLGHLMALRTISLHFDDRLPEKMVAQAWTNLDAVLAQARDTLKEVNIYAPTDKAWRTPLDIAVMRGRLPSVAGKITVYPTNTYT